MLDTPRAKKIQTYIKSHKHSKIEGQQLPIFYGGKVTWHDLYSIPIDDFLIHNIRNGRFRSELLEKEEQLKRNLDPTKKADEKIIASLLLDQNASETTALRSDIIKNGQLEPGIITFDGAIINANRRTAIMRALHNETREEKYKYLKVAILPDGVDELDLWKIEAGLQFGRDFRLQYGGVNELLKLKEGERQGLSAKDISVALTGRFNEKQVIEKLETLKLIESYLAFINKKGEYHLITEAQQLEKFNSLQKSVIAPLTNKHGKKKREIAELTSIAFALIDKTEVTHWDIRELKNISNNPKANSELFGPFKGQIPASSNKVKLNKDKLQEAYTSAQEIVENEREKDRPERLLKRAMSALEGVNDKSKKLKEPEIIALLKSLEKRVSLLITSSRN